MFIETEVSRTLGAEIVRADAHNSQLARCDFSMRADLSASRAAQLAKSAASVGGSTIDGRTEKLIETFGKTIFRSSPSRSCPAMPAIKYEPRVRRMPGSPHGVSTVADLGDAAFGSGTAMLSVRKGKRMIQLTYREIVPLAREVVDQL